MISKPLQWDHYHGAVKPWGAVGILNNHYWADDNGKWESDPDNAGPNPAQAAEAQSKEDQIVLNLLSAEARKVLEASGLLDGTY